MAQDNLRKTIERYSIYELEVARGRVPGTRIFRKYGYNPDIDSGTEDVWGQGGVRVWPTTASAGPCLVVSDVANDTSAGSGGQTIVIEGVDNAWASISSTFNLQGTTTATSTAEFMRVNRAYFTQAGSNGVNEGTITGRVGADVQFTISSAHGQTELGMFSVPANREIVVTEFNVAAGKETAGDQAIILPQMRKNGEGETSWRSLSGIALYQGTYAGDPATYAPPKTDFRVQVVSDFTNLEVSLVMIGYEFDV